jgi:two-component system NtrC family sensor kinase
VRFLEANEVDIIVSDVRMPGAIDGVHLYHWVRKHRPELANRFLFVSGDLIGMNTGQFFVDSSAPRIQKPFKFENYSRAIRRVLDG